ncbi:MAG: TraR/DksA C4-type zinc finger protein [Betaproteobacteria bacterium]
MAEKRPERREGIDPRRVCARLSEEAERLRQEIGLLEEHGLQDGQGDQVGELSTYDNHPADLGTETFERAKDLALRDNLRLRLRQVERARERLKEGTYGRCEVCGALIDPERLEAKPEATRCLACQEEQNSIERNAVERNEGGQPIEEDLLSIGTDFGSQRDPGESNAFDAEDAWQAVARYGTANSPQDVPDAVNYDESFYNADEDLGLVEETDALIDPSQGGIEGGELTEDFYDLGRRGQRRRPHEEPFRGARP